jgi:predicted Rossmann fold nucleotide-binding protein DprA/Smf involved in DNA uptake
MKTIKPSTNLEIKQARTFKAREEERAIEQKAIEQLQNMPDLQKNILKTSFMEKMSLREAELKKVLAEIQLKGFIFERILYANQKQYPNLFKEYEESKRN